MAHDHGGDQARFESRSNQAKRPISCVVASTPAARRGARDRRATPGQHGKCGHDWHYGFALFAFSVSLKLSNSSAALSGSLSRT